MQLVAIVLLIVTQGRQDEVWRMARGGGGGGGVGGGGGGGGGGGAPAVLGCAALCSFLAVALPGALIMWLEWWSVATLHPHPHPHPDAHDVARVVVGRSRLVAHRWPSSQTHN